MQLRIDALELNAVDPGVLTVTARQLTGPFKNVTVYADMPADPRHRTPFFLGEVVPWAEFWARAAQWDGNTADAPPPGVDPGIAFVRESIARIREGRV